jgi:septal ring factor EnvC (AmiA/AmiB activator)
MDKKPFGMDTPEEVYPKHSPKKSKGHGGHSLASSMAKSLGASSASKSKTGGLSKFKKSASMVQNMVRVSSAVAAPRVPSLASAVDREDWDELTKRNDEYFARLVSSQAETFDSLTDMVDALSKKLNDATKSSHDLVSKLSELDELIDEEKRKWKSQNEAEKNAEVLGRSKQLMSSVEDGPGSRSGLGRSFSPRGQ